ncbi:MAG: tetratricopeptide repeat protein [Bacteroidales bacterium]|jgi:tetratricopeptide (TPR) repeat protein|nr:tetratricopeptide repeat protein [Bacteroidales bacterium]
MKKKFILITTMSVFFGISGFAQNDGKAKPLKDDIAKSDIAIKDAKKGSNPATWMTRGKLFRDAYNFNIQYLRQNMPSTEIVLYLGKPKEIITEGDVETYVYSRIKVYFSKGVLTHWEETESIVDSPLTEAVNAYEKAKSLDEKGKLAKKIEEAYDGISRDLEAKAFNEYALKNYKEAYKDAQEKIKVSSLLGKIDTIFYYYAGYFAYTQSEADKSMWKESIDNFDKALSYDFKETGESAGLIYTMLYNSCTAVGDTLKGLSYAEKGFQQNPNDISLIYIMINYYMNRKENQKALDYIEKAKVNDPKNAVLYFAEGSLHDKLGNKEKAIAAYDAAIAIDPTDYGYHYNKGVVYYNSAVKLMEEADKTKTNEEFERLKNLADDEFYKAIPLMEKALELHVGDRDVMETLKSLYFRLRTKYPEMESKYNSIVEKLGS